MHVQAVFIPFIFVRMEEKGKILIIDDNKDVLFALNLLLEPYMQKVKVTTQPARIEYFMRTFQPDVVLLDMNFHRDAVSGQEGFEYLGQILEIDPQAVVIFMTAYSDIEKAVKAIKVGATDFISKPWETEKLLATLSSGIRLSHSRKEVGRLREQMKAMKEDDTLPELIGESPAMLKVKDTIYKLVETDANILITGESGIGKSEVALELIHRGHRLVSDDVVEIKKVSDETLIGSAPDITRHFIELRGIGIIDAKTLFGVESVKNTQSIDLVIQLEEWNKEQEYDRMGLEEQYIEYLGNKVVCHSIPIRPGRNVAIICESAAVNYRQKKMGYNAARELYNRVTSNNFGKA